MLENEFIPYELRTILIELGYSYGAVGYHRPDMKNKPIISEETAVRIHSGTDCLDHPAILYQQAFRWFREKHNLFGCIDLQVCNPPHWYIRIDDIIKNDYLYHSEDENLKFKTYEEAEEECLIKLIGNV